MKVEFNRREFVSSLAALPLAVKAAFAAQNPTPSFPIIDTQHSSVRQNAARGRSLPIRHTGRGRAAARHDRPPQPLPGDHRTPRGCRRHCGRSEPQARRQSMDPGRGGRRADHRRSRGPDRSGGSGFRNTSGPAAQEPAVSGNPSKAVTSRPRQPRLHREPEAPRWRSSRYSTKCRRYGSWSTICRTCRSRVGRRRTPTEPTSGSWPSARRCTSSCLR